jgi:ABC-type hemin transport system substrate-binding protein
MPPADPLDRASRAPRAPLRRERGLDADAATSIGGGSMRIVSMLSSATEIVHALGLGDRLVGISHECDHPPEALHLPRAAARASTPPG